MALGLAHARNCQMRQSSALPAASTHCSFRLISSCTRRASVHKRCLTVEAAKHTAAAAVITAAAPPPVAPVAAVVLQPELAFSSATYIMVPVYLVMAFFPRSKLTKAILGSPVLPVVFSLVYALLAWQAWQAGCFEHIKEVVAAARPLPDAAALAGLFQHQAIAALAWLHLLLLDFLTARAVLMDGLRQLVPTAHSVLLCFMVGPLGLLSHIVTRMVVHKVRGDKPAVASSSMWS